MGGADDIGGLFVCFSDDAICLSVRLLTEFISGYFGSSLGYGVLCFCFQLLGRIIALFAGLIGQILGLALNTVGLFLSLSHYSVGLSLCFLFSIIDELLFLLLELLFQGLLDHILH